MSALSSLKTAGLAQTAMQRKVSVQTPNEGYALRERQRLGECVAKRISGKSAEQMAAQPFCAGQGDGERQNSFPVRGPTPGRARGHAKAPL